MITLEEYIEEHGYSVNDFTSEELDEIVAELELVNNGGAIFDGFFAKKEEEKNEAFLKQLEHRE